jgi:hypothetical protein
MNAHCERVIGTIRREVDHILILGEVQARQPDLGAEHLAVQRRPDAVEHLAGQDLTRLGQEWSFGRLQPGTSRAARLGVCRVFPLEFPRTPQFVA